ncbi:MAG: hypothetical protein Q4G47_08630, partial [Lachnospiraceae bacterium]|nr:hypothetical protein [Lachnospiraceae bacterium]
VVNKNDLDELKKIISEHTALTGSKKGLTILDHFDEYVPRFKKIIPADYRKILGLIADSEAKGADAETAKIEAFRAFTGEEAFE